ncbi:MAG TPA: oligosaccharide flippase family protein [Acidobacteriaceae bacterium]
MTPSAETEATVIAEIEKAGIFPITSAKRRTSLLGHLLSPETAVHQSVVSLADQAVASATNFVTGVIIARSCSKEEFGLYMLGFTIILLVTDFQTSLITTPYMVYAPRLKGRAHALYTGSTLIHQLAFCLVAIFALLCAAFAVTIGFGYRGLEPVLWALVAVISLISFREFARRVCFARLKLITAFLFDTCVAVVQVGGLLVLGHFGLLSASRAYWVIGSACGIAALWWLWSDREFYHPRVSESLADLKKNWIFGKWVFASGLVWTISMNLYPWLLAFFHGTGSAGVWAACLGVVSVGNPALLGIQNLVGPKIAHKYATEGPTELRRLVLKISAALALPLSLLCLVLMLWGGRLVALLYGRQYAGNGLVVAILAINLLVTAEAFSYSRALFAIERADLDFRINLAALFIMAVLGLWLVRVLGPLGAAFGLMGTTLVTSGVRAGAFLRLPARASLEQNP